MKQRKSTSPAGIRPSVRRSSAQPASPMPKGITPAGLCCRLLAVLLSPCLAPSVQAQVYTATVNGPKTLADGDEVRTGNTANAHGLLANGSKITSQGRLTVTTDGSGAMALAALNGGTIATEGKTEITTSGASAAGIYALSSSRIDLGADTTVTTSGDRASGIYVQGTLSSAAGSTVTVTTGAAGGGNTLAHGVSVSLAGSKAQFDKLTVTTASTRGNGIFAASGGSVQVDGLAKVTTNGDDSQGVVASNGSQIELHDADITVKGKITDPYYYNERGALYAFTSTLLTSSTIHVTGGLDARVDGDGVAGIGATGYKGVVSSVTVDGPATISLTGDFGSGVYARQKGAVTLSDATITTSGDNSNGVTIAFAGSAVNFNGKTSIATSGKNSHAIQVRIEALKIFDGTQGRELPSLAVSGEGAAALSAADGGVLIMAGTSALDMGMVAGGGSWGGKAEYYGQLIFAEQSGTGGTPLWISGEGAALSFFDQADGAGSRVRLEDQGTLKVRGGQLRLGSLEGTADTGVDLGAGSLIIGVDNAAGNGSLLARADYAGLISGTGCLIKTGDTVQILSGINTYTGATVVEGGRLQAGAAGVIASSTDVIVNGGTFDLGGYDQRVQHLSGAGSGRIALGAANLTVYNEAGRDTAYAGAIMGAGQLIKTGAGELALSGTTAWSGPTSIQGGSLTLDGSAGAARLVGDIVGQSGSTFKLVGGATLTGQIDPADVVITGPASTWNDTGASVIDSLTLVSGGNYRFTAPVGGSYKTLTINGKLEGKGNIMMNTDLGAQQGDRIVVHETAGQHSIAITNRGGDPGGPGQSLKLIEVGAPGLSNGTFALPSGQVDVGAYRYDLLRGEQLTDAGGSGDAGDWYLANLNARPSQLTNDMLAAANTAKYATFASLNNLHKRLGELRLDQDGGAGNDLWMRAYEKRYTLHLDGSVDQKVDGFEAGYDHQFRFDGGRFYIGALAGGGQSRIDSNRDGSGSIDNNQIGAYATWILDNGIYVDLIGRHFWFKHDYRLQPLGGTLPETGSSNNTAWSLDVETGKRFDFKDGWYLEPQAELNWLHSSRAGFTTSLGNRITLDSGRTVNGRLGLAGGKVLKSDSGRLTQVYGRLDWTKDLNSDGRVAINGNSFDAVKDDGAWIAAIGVQTAGGEQNRLQFYTEVEAGLGSPAVKQDWGVNVGLRWAF
ncbi:MAG: autotransporter outer membrane beta-barrel domain-containing protein [Desulfocapsaceae bacterium]|nr:autotransporter outer membrane beta-barrel domain-containing protein [Desulfocapsaceae bacterium]